MPGPYEKFETAFEAFQEQLRKEIHEELEAYYQKFLTELEERLRDDIHGLIVELQKRTTLTEGEEEAVAAYWRNQQVAQFKPQVAQFKPPVSQRDITKQQVSMRKPPQQTISSDLADILRKEERDE